MLLRVKDIANLAPDIWQITLSGDFPYKTVKPGQFIMIRIGSGKEHVLRRPISIAAVTEQSLTIVLRVVGRGTKWLSERCIGDLLDVLGPLGRGFPSPPQDAKVLIVGGGLGVPPLWLLGETIQAEADEVDVVLGFRSQRDCILTDEFSRLGHLVVTTDDGSFGIKGNVIEAVDSLRRSGHSWEYVYACGPLPMLRNLKRYFSNQDVKGYVSLEEHMACGVGACHGCVCLSEDRSLTRRICVNGPVFPWNEVCL
ncbi:MAG: dihydroorotate dehydrogenase electron transfer subunit [Firmicutes bacterium]|nr:dihydroorotate dehydrogenase electron transfer subunit [Bacillota bacterium]